MSASKHSVDLLADAVADRIVERVVHDITLWAVGYADALVDAIVEQLLERGVRVEWVEPEPAGAIAPVSGSGHSNGAHPETEPIP